jgi:cytochrome c nitrite reductase small subunit
VSERPSTSDKRPADRIPRLRLFVAGSAAGLMLSWMLGVLAGLGGYTFYYAEGASYLSDDPRACVNCHIMRDYYDDWQKASHHAHATCNDCHLPHDNFFGTWYTKAESGFLHAWAFTFDDFHEPIRMREKSARILDNNCLRCHADLVSDIVPHIFAPAETGIRSCVRCHEQVGHGPPR